MRAKLMRAKLDAIKRILKSSEYIVVTNRGAMSSVSNQNPWFFTYTRKQVQQLERDYKQGKVERANRIRRGEK